MARSHLVADHVDNPSPLVHHGVAGRIDRIDEVAVDEDAGQNPAAQQQDEGPHRANLGAEPLAAPDAEGAAPPRARAEAPLVAEGEAEGERPENHDERERENRVVEQDGALANDAHPHQRQHHGDEHPEDAERTADELLAQPGTRTPAEVLYRVVVERAVAADALQHAQVGRPAEEGEEDRRRGEKPREKEQQAERPAGAVAVRTGGLLTTAGGGIFGCHGICA